MPSVTTGAVGRRPGQALMPLLGLQLRLSRPPGQQNARWARCVASRNRGAARHSSGTHRVFCWAFLGQAGRPRVQLVFVHYGCQCPRYLDFCFLARQASKTPCGRVAGPPGTGRNRKNKKARGLPQPSCPASHAPRSGGDAPRIKTLDTLEKFLFYFNLVFRNATVLTARPMPVIGESGLPSSSKGRMVLVE